MFIKSFKQKSNVQIKTSNHKKLKQKINQSFPSLSESDLLTLFPNKSTVNVIKIVTFTGFNTNVYSVDKRPMFFEDESNHLIPTLYTLWLIPDILPYFTTHPAVLPRLANGADLMLPGVIRFGSGINSYGYYKKDTLVAVNLTSNKAAIGIGRLVRSSEDLYMCGGHGSCVKFLNVFGDNLWNLEPSVSSQIPIFDPVLNLPNDHDFPELSSNKIKKISSAILKCAIEENILEETSNLKPDSENCNKLDNEIEKQEKYMDKIVKIAFLTALKMDCKKLILPILSSNFFRLHLLPHSEEPIDMKQTSFKKLSKFLKEMAKQNFIVVLEVTKGIEKIISIDLEHPELVNFVPAFNNTSLNCELKKSKLFHVEMTELYFVTKELVELFSKYNYNIGEGVTSFQIKSLLKEYINKSTCVKINNVIELDTCLAKICNKENLTLDEIYHIILSKMIHSFEMRGKNETINNKPPIQISLATRSGNKKVTLVSNLETYGIILSEFCKVCKQGAAASTTIVKSLNQKQDQFQIQGNQIKFLQKLLTETYKIPSKQIHGTELLQKKKKKVF